jgi:hypothetical protein
MKTMTVAVAVLAIASAGSAVAQGNPRNAMVNAQSVGPSRPSKTVSKVHPPVGTPHKASSFAPHPTKKRVFGDPIQPPIVHNVPPAPSPKKTAPK